MYKFALVGCGRIAKRHAELLSGVVGGAKLVAVCDTDEARARSFGEKYASFLRKSNYSNWKGDSFNISRMSDSGHKRSYSSTQGDHFFKTTKDNKN